MVDVAHMIFCWRCFKRQLFRSIDTQELLWVCGVCGAVRDLTEYEND